ncbi:BREX protein BrxB domain-containing protein, partial [Acinetobacter guillouiae]|uniref:BREX protein BrxB domain-containing protein n=1 Tax=Acinetobacter guillouiae TaxID=106649 RepID=UPI003AF7436B
MDDLVGELLKCEGDWDWLLEHEQDMSREELKDELQGILDVETVITPELAKRMKEEEHDLMLLTGIGEVFPYIR